MYPHSTLSRAAAVSFLLLSLCATSRAQAPPSIQFFMPDGSLPPRELRFTLTSDDGKVDSTFFTDSKGRFLITRSQGLRPDMGYTITIESDGRAFDKTVQRFKEYNVYYIMVFLRPLDPRTKPAGAVDLAELDLEVPKEAREAYDNAMRALKAGRADEAITQLNLALAKHPKYFHALNDLGVTYMKVGQLDNAALTLERAIKLAPRVYYPRLNLGIVRTRQAKYKEAIALLDELHKEIPGLAEVRVPLADALMAAGRLDEAEPHLRVALADEKLDGQPAGNAHYLLGLLLNRKQKFDEAVKELTTAAKLVPNSARIHLQLGGALLQVKRMDDAERELLSSYQLGGPQMGAAQFLLGELYFLEKKYEKAMRAFEQYLADVPQAPNAAEVKGVIAKIKAALSQK